MHKVVKKLLTPKKVSLQDVASPRPSRSANRVIKSALKQAHVDQQTLKHKATAIRSN